MVKTFSNTLQPLNWRYPIVDRNGCATLEFQRAWAQQQRANASIPDLTDADAVSVVVDTLSKQYGSIIYRSFDKWLGLPPGKDTQVLTVKKGVPTYADAAPVVPSLDEGKIFVGDSSNTAAQVNMSGDATIADSGAVTVVGTHLADGSAGSPSGSIHAGDTGFFWDSTNSAVGLSISGSEKVFFGGSTTVFSTSGAGYVHKIMGEGVTNNIVEFYGTTAGSARYSCRSARGTIASPAASQQFDEVARWINLGYDGANFQVATRISTFLIEPTPSSTAMGGRMSLYATTLGATTNTEVVRIEAAKTNILGPVKIGSISATPDASALLDLQSTTQGFLPPRMTTTQRNAISSPADGLVVYDSTVGAFYFRQSSAWVKLADVQALLDLIGNTQGDVLYRGASSWAALAPGTSGQFLKTQGAGANPVWDTPSGGGASISPFFENGTLSPPSTSTMSIERSTTSTTSSLSDLAASRGAVLVMPKDTTSRMIVLGKSTTAPNSSTNTLTAMVYGNGLNNAVAFGIYQRDSTGKIFSLWVFPSSTALQRATFTDINTASPTATTISSSFVRWHVPLWLKMSLASGNYTFSFSFDGETWMSGGSVATPLGATLTDCGILLTGAGASVDITALDCFSLAVS